GAGTRDSRAAGRAEPARERLAATARLRVLGELARDLHAALGHRENRVVAGARGLAALVAVALAREQGVRLDRITHGTAQAAALEGLTHRVLLAIARRVLCGARAVSSNLAPRVLYAASRSQYVRASGA